MESPVLRPQRVQQNLFSLHSVFIYECVMTMSTVYCKNLCSILACIISLGLKAKKKVFNIIPCYRRNGGLERLNRFYGMALYMINDCS